MGERTVCELTSADIPGALQAINRQGIDIWDVIYTGDLTIRFTVEKKNTAFLRDVTERRGDRLRQVRRLGLSRKLLPWMRHPLLLGGIILLLVLTVWLPTRVLFIRVEGNHTVPSKLILEQAEQCGIVFGSDRSAVRSEKMKNALLEALPQLQWAGINTTGCVATITVRERSVPPEEGVVVSDIVAARDGIIRTCTVQNGTALCAPGQAVRAGEVLISGLTDCGIAILVTGAEGEVFAETNRRLSARSMESALYRSALKGEEHKFSILIGKKRINLYNDSGILDTTCVKIYSQYYLTLPGGFQLPIGIGMETVCSYDAAETEITECVALMTDYSRRYLLEHMTAGQIMDERTVPAGNALYADYICLEMIGQNRYEEITKENGKNYGENS